MSAAHAPVRLVDDFQAGYIKFNGREPRTLEELAVARADYDHKCQLATVKAIRTKLSLLDAFVPELAARGIKIADREIGTLDGGKTLRIQSPLFNRDDKLLAALLELGFREVERKPWGGGDELVTLKHGRALLVSIDVRKPAAAA